MGTIFPLANSRFEGGFLTRGFFMPEVWQHIGGYSLGVIGYLPTALARDF